MEIERIVQDIDVAVCARLGRDAVPQHGDFHAHKIRGRIVADNGFGVPKLPIEC